MLLGKEQECITFLKVELTKNFSTQTFHQTSGKF